MVKKRLPPKFYDKTIVIRFWPKTSLLILIIFLFRTAIQMFTNSAKKVHHPKSVFCFLEETTDDPLRAENFCQYHSQTFSLSREWSKRVAWLNMPELSEALERDWLIAAGAYPGFCSMERLGVFLLPLDWMLFHRRSLLRNLLGFPNNFAGTQLYSRVERVTVRVTCLAQEHCSRPGPLAPETTQLTMGPPHLS